MADDVQVKIGADTHAAKDGIKSLENTTKDSTAQISASLQRMSDQSQVATQKMVKGMAEAKQGIADLHSSISSRISSMVSSFQGLGAAITAIAAGGAFKSIIDSTITYVGEAKKLSIQMGTDVNTAAAYLNAYKRVGVGFDDLSMAMRRMLVTMRSNPEAFDKLGVSLTDSDGKLRSMIDIFEDTKRGLEEVSETTYRAGVAQEIFGARTGDVTNLLKVKGESVQNAKKMLESLGLTIGSDMVNNIAMFKAGLVDMQTILFALAYKIASEVIPVCVRFSQWMRSDGAAGAIAFGRALGSIVSALGSVVAAAGRAASAVSSFLSMIPGATTAFKLMGSIPGVGGLFSGAGMLGGGGADTFKAPTLDDFGLGKVGKGHLDVDLGKGGKGGGGGGGKGGGGGGAEKSRLAEWQAELEQMQMADEQFHEMSKEEERKFWQDKLAICAEGGQEYQQIQRKIYQVSKEIHQKEMADAKAAGKENARIAEMEVETQTALGKLELESKRDQLQQERDLKKITKAEELKSLKMIKAEELQIEIRALEEKKKLNMGDRLFQEKAQRDMLVLKRKNANEISKIDHQISKEEQTTWTGIFGGIKSAFSGMLSTLTSGVADIGSMFLSLGQSILSVFTGVLSEIAFKWIESFMMGAVASKVTSAQQVMNQAGVGYAAAMASTAAIPIVGPGLAPGVASAIMADILATGLPLASAAGGWDVPSDALAMIHKREMVIPAHLADRIRGMTGGSGANVTVNYSPTNTHRMTAADYRADAKLMVAAIQRELGNQGLKIGGPS
jgi:hypothetical protein